MGTILDWFWAALYRPKTKINRPPRRRRLSGKYHTHILEKEFGSLTLYCCLPPIQSNPIHPSCHSSQSGRFFSHTRTPIQETTTPQRRDTNKLYKYNHFLLQTNSPFSPSLPFLSMMPRAHSFRVAISLLLFLSFTSQFILSAQLQPTHPIHTQHHGLRLSGSEHPSHFPSVKIESRTLTHQQREFEQDRKTYQALLKNKLIDVEGNSMPSIQSDPSMRESSPQSPVDDLSTVDFLSKASSTLNNVMQHDGEAIFHFKSLVQRAKRSLAHNDYDTAAVLFKEASQFYFKKLQEPYAKIASSKALGTTIEQRISAQLESERGSSTSTSTTVNTAAQQFREKELANHPHVHTAFLEYAQHLRTKAKNSNIEQKTVREAKKEAEKKATRRRR